MYRLLLRSFSRNVQEEPYARRVHDPLPVYAAYAENDDAEDETVNFTIEEAVEKLESSGIEVRSAPKHHSIRATVMLCGVMPS